MIKEYYNPRVYIYILECIIGLCICYTLYKHFPQHQFYWSMISAVLVIAPDGKDSDRLAIDRMKANILGSLIGVVAFSDSSAQLVFNLHCRDFNYRHWHIFET